MSVCPGAGLIWIGAALAAGLLAGCDERTKKASDPSRPPVPKVAHYPLKSMISQTNYNLSTEVIVVRYSAQRGTLVPT